VNYERNKKGARFFETQCIARFVANFVPIAEGQSGKN